MNRNVPEDAGQDNGDEYGKLWVAAIDGLVMERLKAPFKCEYIRGPDVHEVASGRWRISDANDDAIASCAGLERGYAELIVEALNQHPRFKAPPVRGT